MNNIINIHNLSNKFYKLATQLPVENYNVSKWQIFYVFHNKFGNKYNLNYDSYQNEKPVSAHPSSSNFDYDTSTNYWGPAASFIFCGHFDYNDKNKIESAYETRFPNMIKAISITPDQLNNQHEVKIQFETNVDLN